MSDFYFNVNQNKNKNCRKIVVHSYNTWTHWVRFGGAVWQKKYFSVFSWIVSVSDRTKKNMNKMWHTNVLCPVCIECRTKYVLLANYGFGVFNFRRNLSLVALAVCCGGVHNRRVIITYIYILFFFLFFVYWGSIMQLRWQWRW